MGDVRVRESVVLIGKGFFITYADMLPNEGQYPPGGPGTGHRGSVQSIDPRTLGGVPS